jgi:hypothetical protein
VLANVALAGRVKYCLVSDAIKPALGTVTFAMIRHCVGTSCSVAPRSKGVMGSAAARNSFLLSPMSMSVLLSKALSSAKFALIVNQIRTLA